MFKHSMFSWITYGVLTVLSSLKLAQKQTRSGARSVRHSWKRVWSGMPSSPSTTQMTLPNSTKSSMKHQISGSMRTCWSTCSWFARKGISRRWTPCWPTPMLRWTNWRQWGAHVANLPTVGDRLLDEALDEAAKIIFSHISNWPNLPALLSSFTNSKLLWMLPTRSTARGPGMKSALPILLQRVCD